jgi:hypothetical protein
MVKDIYTTRTFSVERQLVIFRVGYTWNPIQCGVGGGTLIRVAYEFIDRLASFVGVYVRVSGLNFTS